MTLAILGGSFNPPHLGHLILAEEALDQLKADRCLFLPAYKAPHKAMASGASDQDRLDMVAAAMSSDPRFILDPREIKRGGLSYTLDSLREIVREYDLEQAPFLIIGDDLVPGFPSWKEPEEIARLSIPVIAHRSSKDFPEFPYPHRQIENILIPLSSTLVRERIQTGKAFRQLVSPGVYSIIRQRGLYAYQASD